MNRINFSCSRGGKIFNDQFDEVVAHDKERNMIGNRFDIYLKGQMIGTAKIIHVFTFPFLKLNDSLSLRYYGKGVSYMAAIIKRQNHIEYDSRLDQICLQYTFRDIDQQRILLQEWWAAKEAHNNETNIESQTKLNF